MRCNWLQRALGLPETAGGMDAMHQQTEQPTPGAMSYAYTHLGLPLYTPIGATTAARGGFISFEPQGYQFQHIPLTGIGGVQAGTSLLTQLLVNQADAVARGLAR